MVNFTLNFTNMVTFICHFFLYKLYRLKIFLRLKRKSIYNSHSLKENTKRDSKNRSEQFLHALTPEELFMHQNRHLPSKIALSRWQAKLKQKRQAAAQKSNLEAIERKKNKFFKYQSHTLEEKFENISLDVPTFNSTEILTPNFTNDSEFSPAQILESCKGLLDKMTKNKIWPHCSIILPNIIIMFRTFSTDFPSAVLALYNIVNYYAPADASLAVGIVVTLILILKPNKKKAKSKYDSHTQSEQSLAFDYLPNINSYSMLHALGGLILTFFCLIFLYRVPSRSDFDSVFNRFGKISQNFSGINSLYTKCTELSTVCIDWYKERYFNIIPASREFTTRLTNLQQAIIEAYKLDNQTKLFSDINQVTHVDNLMQESLLLISNMPSRNLNEQHKPYHAQVLTLHRKALVSPQRGAKSRVTPVVVHMYGNAGVGKTALLSPLSIDLLKHLDKTSFLKMALNFGRHIFYRKCGMKFWTNYNASQHIITIIDDANQITQKFNEAIPFPGEIIHLANSAECPLEVPDVENKPFAFFNSRVLLVTDNMKDPPLTDVIMEEDAYKRRIHFEVKVTINPKHGFLFTGSKESYYKMIPDVKTLNLEKYLFTVTSANSNIKYEDISYTKFLSILTSELDKTSNDHAAFQNQLSLYAAEPSFVNTAELLDVFEDTFIPNIEAPEFKPAEVKPNSHSYMDYVQPYFMSKVVDRNPFSFYTTFYFNIFFTLASPFIIISSFISGPLIFIPYLTCFSCSIYISNKLTISTWYQLFLTHYLVALSIYTKCLARLNKVKLLTPKFNTKLLLFLALPPLLYMIYKLTQRKKKANDNNIPAILRKLKYFSKLSGSARLQLAADIYDLEEIDQQRFFRRFIKITNNTLRLTDNNINEIENAYTFDSEAIYTHNDLKSQRNNAKPKFNSEILTKFFNNNTNSPTTPEEEFDIDYCPKCTTKEEYEIYVDKFGYPKADEFPSTMKCFNKCNNTLKSENIYTQRDSKARRVNLKPSFKSEGLMSYLRNKFDTPDNAEDDYDIDYCPKCTSKDEYDIYVEKFDYPPAHNFPSNLRCFNKCKHTNNIVADVSVKPNSHCFSSTETLRYPTCDDILVAEQPSLLPFQRITFDLPQSHYLSDQNTQEIINSAIHSNLYSLKITYSDNDHVHKCNVLFICGQLAITTAHSFLSCNNTSILTLKNDDLEYSVPFNQVKLCRVKRDGKDRDIVYITFPRSYIPVHKNIIHKFLPFNQLTQNFRCQAVCTSYRWRKADTKVTLAMHYTDMLYYSPNTINTGLPATLYDFHYHRSTTSYGDCGAPLLILNNKIPQKIVGIHAAGSQDSGIALFVSREELEYVVNLNSSHCLTIQNFSESIQFNAPLEYMFKKNFALTELQSGNFTPIAKIKNTIFAPKETKIQPSLLHNTIIKPTTKPAILSNQGFNGTIKVNIFTNNLRKYFAETKNISPNTLQYIHYRLVHRFGGATYNKLSIEEAIKGNDILVPLDRTTSAGLPWILQNKPLKGKATWLGQNDTWVIDNVELLNKINEFEKSVNELNVIPPIFFIDQTKDERRPIHKVDQGKTRMFAIGPMHFSILFRKYFSWFDSHVKINRIKNGSLVGIDPNATEWTRVYHHMTRINDPSKNCYLAGDYSNFDGSLNRSVLWEIFSSILEIGNINEQHQDYKIMVALWTCLTDSLHIHKQHIYQLNHSQPSGNPFTTMINTLYNLGILDFVLFKILHDKNKLVENYDDHVAIYAYGDDNLMIFSDYFIEHIDPQLITKTLNEMGHTYTTDLKDDSLQAYRSISEVSILKRKFDFDPNLFYCFAPLELEVILEMINWDKETNHSLKLSQLFSNGDVIQRELLHHPEYIYTDKWTNLILPALINMGFENKRSFPYHILRQLHISSKIDD